MQLKAMTAATAMVMCVLACGDGSDVASESPPSPPSNEAFPCSNLASRTLCMNAANSAQHFTAPNTLAPMGYALASQNQSSGCIYDRAPAPNPLGAQGAAWAYVSCGFATGAIYSTNFAAPGPFPPGDGVGLFGSVPYSGANAAACSTNSKYQACAVTQVGQGLDASMVFAVTNLPVTISITNKLTGTLTRQAAPLIGELLQDPNGGDPATIAAEATAYYGFYRTTSHGAGLNFLRADYEVSGSKDAALDGAIIRIGPTFLPGDSTLGGTCIVEKPATTNTVTCEMKATGSGNAPITIDIVVSAP